MPLKKGEVQRLKGEVERLHLTIRAKNTLLALDRFINKPTSDTTYIAKIAARQIGKLLKTKACLVTLRDKRKKRLNIIGSHNAEPIAERNFIPMKSLTGKAVRTNSVQIVPNIALNGFVHYKDLSKQLKLVSSVVNPIRIKGKAIGAITVLDSRKRKFSDNELNILRHFSDRIAFSMENAHQRLTDTLTGIGNSRRLGIKLDEALQRMRESTGAKKSPTSFIFMDLDGFKKINDKYGHNYGDQYLRSVSDVLLKVARNRDTLARYGGDEFGIVLPETDQEGVRKFLNRLEEERIVANKLREKRNEPPIEFSIGTHTSVLRSETADSMRHKADLLLYKHKQTKKELGMKRSERA